MNNKHKPKKKPPMTPAILRVFKLDSLPPMAVKVEVAKLTLYDTYTTAEVHHNGVAKVGVRFFRLSSTVDN